MRYKVIEKNNPLAVHCITWSEQRGLEWIERYGNSGMFIDKTLTKESFIVVKAEEGAKHAKA